MFPAPPVRASGRRPVPAFLFLLCCGSASFATPPKAEPEPAVPPMVEVKAPPEEARGPLKAIRTVKGHKLQPGANLVKADLSRKDLRNAQLMGADLTDADLREADLRGADLSGAILVNADLRGAKLTGARLWRANMFKARGWSYRGLAPLPFFAEVPGEPIGTVRELVVKPDWERWPQPRKLLAGLDGGLLVMEEGNPVLGTIHPSGVWGDHNLGGLRPLAVAQDSRERIWVFYQPPSGDVNRFIIPRGEERDLRLKSKEIIGMRGLTCAAGGAGGTVAVGFDRACATFTSGGVLRVPLPFTPSKVGFVDSLLGSGAQALFAADAGNLVIHSPAADALRRFQAPEGATFGAIAPGAPDQLWVVQAETDTLLRYATDKAQEPRPFRVTFPGCTGPLGLRGLALGPDGNMWFSMTANRSLGRLTRDGTLTRFPLPEGMVAMDLFGGADEVLWFTLQGRPAIASIRVRPAAGSAAGPAAPAGPTGFELPAFQPRPERRSTLSRAARHERLRLAMERDNARVLEGEKEEPEVELGAGGEAAGAEAKDRKQPAAPPRKAPAPAAPAVMTDEEATAILDNLNVNLTPWRLRKIQNFHTGFAMPNKSQFMDTLADPKHLRAFLALGLENAGVIGRVHSDTRGRFYTYCRTETTAGHCWSNRAEDWVATTRFVVLTEPCRVGDETFHDVISAYPVPEAW